MQGVVPADFCACLDTNVNHIGSWGIDPCLRSDRYFEAFFGQELYSTSQIGTTARSMTRAFAFFPPLLLLPRFAERLGADRVVLGRELSIKEIASVAADVDDLEVEAQVLTTNSF